MPGKNVRHKSFNVKSKHLVFGISESITNIISQIEYFASLLNQVYINGSELRTINIDLIFLIDSFFQ